MRILPISQTIASEINKVEQSRKLEKTEKSGKVQKSDRSEFSSNAQRLSDTKASVEILAAHVEVQPEIREDKVAEVRRKIQDGFYNSPDFTDKLAEKLMNDFGFSGV